MTPGEVLAEVSAAVDARLVAGGCRVAGAASSTYPYVTTYVSSPLAPTEDFGDSRSRLVFYINTVTVGSSEAQCEALEARVVDALYRWRPTVGARSWRVEHTAAMPVGKDDSLPDRVVWTARDSWSLSVIR